MSQPRVERGTPEKGLDIFDRHGLCYMPGVRRATMTTKELRTVLLECARPVLLSGVMWDIVSKKVGPGVYDVWLERHEYEKEAQRGDGD